MLGSRGWEEQPHVPGLLWLCRLSLLGASGSLHEDGVARGTDGTCMRTFPCRAGQGEGNSPSCPWEGWGSILPACRTLVPGSLGRRTGFLGSPKVRIGEGVTLSSNNLTGAMCTDSPLSPTAVGQPFHTQAVLLQPRVKGGSCVWQL